MTKALIIGGGIAGPATAIALRKAGITAAVYETYPADASDDAAPSSPSPPTAKTPSRPSTSSSPSSTSLPRPVSSACSTRPEPKSPTLPSAVTTPCLQTITRALLSTILRAEATGHGIPLAYGKRLTGVTSRGGQVTALSDDGSTPTPTCSSAPTASTPSSAHSSIPPPRPPVTPA